MLGLFLLIVFGELPNNILHFGVQGLLHAKLPIFEFDESFKTVRSLGNSFSLPVKDLK